MKKLLLATVLLSATGLAYAHCPDNAQKIVSRIKSHNVNAINVTYSSDKADWATTLQKNIASIDSNVKVNLISTSGSDVCKITKG